MTRILKRSLALGVLLALTGVTFAGSARTSNEGTSPSAQIVGKFISNLATANAGRPGIATPVVLGAPARNGSPIVPYDPPVDQNGNPLVDPVVYNSFCPAGPNAVTDPDGQPVTYSKWVKATGSATMKCQGNGTRVTVRLTGLLPHGVYSTWVIVFGPGPALPDGSNLLGVGALGRPDGSQNHFVASENGEGQLDVIMPAGVLSEIPYPVGPCLLTDPNLGEVHVGLAYHIDGQTHGGSPGDPCSFALPLAFSFVTH